MFQSLKLLNHVLKSFRPFEPIVSSQINWTIKFWYVEDSWWANNFVSKFKKARFLLLDDFDLVQRNERVFPGWSLWRCRWTSSSGDLGDNSTNVIMSQSNQTEKQYLFYFESFILTQFLLKLVHVEVVIMKRG